MQYLALTLAFLALLLFWLSARRRQAAGLPGGRVVYTDTRAWGAVEKPLYDAGLGLTGKPDYLVEKSGTLIPVEVKSGHAPEVPYDSHIYQLAAYCLLVERVMGKRPPHGLIHYTGKAGASRTYAVDYTAALEAAVLELLAELRSIERRKEVERSHEIAARCTRCGYRSTCTEKLS